MCVAAFLSSCIVEGTPEYREQCPLIHRLRVRSHLHVLVQIFRLSITVQAKLIGIKAPLSRSANFTTINLILKILVSQKKTGLGHVGVKTSMVYPLSVHQWCQHWTIPKYFFLYFFFSHRHINCVHHMIIRTTMYRNLLQWKDSKHKTHRYQSTKELYKGSGTQD